MGQRLPSTDAASTMVTRAFRSVMAIRCMAVGLLYSLQGGQAAASAAPIPPMAVQQVQAPVVAVSRIAASGTQPSGIAYHVIYQYQGRQYSTVMPQDPGAQVTIEVPRPAPPVTSGNSPAMVTVQVMALQSVQTYPARPPVVRYVGVVDRRPLRVVQAGHHLQVPSHAAQAHHR